LIIVTGCMRTGTTLLHRLVSTSPDTGPMLGPARYMAEQVASFRRYRRADWAFIRGFFPNLDAFAAHVRDGLRRFLESAWETSGRPKALVVKSADFSYQVALVAELLPEARFVVSVRDPKDTITSILKVTDRHQREGIPTARQAGRDIRRLCKTYNGAYLATLRALRSQRLALPERITFVKYEDVVSDAKAALSPVWEACGIAPGDPAGLKDFSDSDDAVTASQGLTRYWRAFLTDLTSRAVSAASVGSHRNLLTPEESRLVDWRCRGVRRRFGYA
jgi:hypothetical protein